MLTLELPKKLERRLAALAKRSGRPIAQLGHEAILDYVGDLEAAYVAVDRLEKGGKRYTHEEVVRNLGLLED